MNTTIGQMHLDFLKKIQNTYPIGEKLESVLATNPPLPIHILIDGNDFSALIGLLSNVIEKDADDENKRIAQEWANTLISLTSVSHDPDPNPGNKFHTKQERIEQVIRWAHYDQPAVKRYKDTVSSLVPELTLEKIEEMYGFATTISGVFDVQMVAVREKFPEEFKQ